MWAIAWLIKKWWMWNNLSSIWNQLFCIIFVIRCYIAIFPQICCATIEFIWLCAITTCAELIFFIHILSPAFSCVKLVLYLAVWYIVFPFLHINFHHLSWDNGIEPTPYFYACFLQAFFLENYYFFPIIIVKPRDFNTLSALSIVGILEPST